MDANLRFWRAEGQSFFQRFLLWADVLDPLLLLKSADEIRTTRLLIQNSGKTLNEPIQNDEVQAKQTFFCQFVLHTYTTGFTLFNGNGTAKAEEYSVQQKQVVCGLGAISYAACIGAFPLFFMNRYTLKNSLMQLVVRKLLPAPLLGLMSAFTVAVVRSPEFENGIEVMDRNGKVVGVSQKAGEKAVKETALSRAVLFGTAFFLPAVITYFLERKKFAKTPRALASVRMFAFTSVLAGMLPVSLSMFPQCGEIKRADLEPEILSSTEETELFYNRGI
ncbi:sideroflexin-4 isoform X3 [Tyto alba]|uniref:sideroflexin-4 isoform X3 n=1 Tax=Tyto alba TaxID=56313 RepID=UPI001C67A01B|nr:sideroflexin-4 isoform X3 [Tyto alba]